MTDCIGYRVTCGSSAHSCMDYEVSLHESWIGLLIEEIIPYNILHTCVTHSPSSALHSYYSICMMSLSLTPHAHTCTHTHTSHTHTHTHTHTHAPTHTCTPHVTHIHTHAPTHTCTPHVTHTHTHTTANPFRLASLELVESNTYSLRKKLITHLVKCHLLW